jgi:hypothetical protein
MEVMAATLTPVGAAVIGRPDALDLGAEEYRMATPTPAFRADVLHAEYP